MMLFKVDDRPRPVDAPRRAGIELGSVDADGAFDHKYSLTVSPEVLRQTNHFRNDSLIGQYFEVGFVPVNKKVTFDRAPGHSVLDDLLRPMRPTSSSPYDGMSKG